MFWAGARATLPLLTSVAPFGMLVGAMGPAAGVPVSATLAMSPVMFAGSSQLLAMQMLSTGTTAVVLLLTTFVVNLRHVLYGVSLAPHMRPLSRSWKWLLAYFMTDEVYAISISRFTGNGNSPTANLHWFYLGSGVALWLCWLASTAVGVVFGSRIPASWGLDFAIALTFIALVVPVLANRASVLAAVVGAGLAVLLVGLPYSLGIVAAAIGGIVAGMSIDLGWIVRKSAVPLPSKEESAT